MVLKFNTLSRLNIVSVDELTALANYYGSDKGSVHKDAHCYTRIYSKIFSSIKTKNIVFLEIGLLRTDEASWRQISASSQARNTKGLRAPSLQIWREYFPNAKLYGFDIDDFSAVSIPNCTIVQGDSSNPADLARLADTIGAPIDVIIEDASHASPHQQIALANLFPHLASGGLFIIEDLGWQDPIFEPLEGKKTRNLLREFQVTGKCRSTFMSTTQSEYLEKNVASVEMYDSMVKNLEMSRDAVAVLKKV